MTVCTIVVILNISVAFFAGAAAVLWFRSAKVTLPKTFAIHVVRPNHTHLPNPMGGTYIGNGYSQDIQNLGEALSNQSKLSATVAICAGISAVLQVIVIILPNLLRCINE